MVARLQNKIALVVGAGSIGPGWGNGKATAVLFAREGAKVVCADVNEDAANETAQIIRRENGMANAVCADVTSHDDVRRMVEAFMGGSISSTTTSALLMSAYSGDCDQPFRPKVIIDSGDRDHTTTPLIASA